jgi:Formate hydrogenlyase subunit 6/NADH:ubiquinone oxidoreductase 23 kD subunit (chain I)
MVFYFSATGNSKYAAEKVHDEFGGELISIASMLHDGKKTYTVAPDEKVIVVFPVYFAGLPGPVIDFIKNVEFTAENPEIIGIGTYGSLPGGVDKAFANAFKKAGYEVRAFYAVKMVENFILLFSVPIREKQLMILNRADAALTDVIDSIRFNNRMSYHSSVAVRPLSAIEHSFYAGSCGTAKFTAAENCIGCGLCQTVCAANAIEMDEGRPTWTKAKCYHCLACIHRCPVEAIQYGRSTTAKRRYYNPKLK